MKKIIIIFLTFIWVLNSYSQEFGTHWISYPHPNDSSEILFRKTFTSKHRPQQALITFASCGKVRVYVNERNISRDLHFANTDTSSIVSRTLDITRFLNAEKNIIAVWYAPVPNMPISKQLSLEYYGRDLRGKTFYYKTDQGWYCKMLKGSYNNTKEQFDSRHYNNDWKGQECSIASWLHPVGAFASEKSLAIHSKLLPSPSLTLNHVIEPIAYSSDSAGVTYDFGRMFKGTIRLTLRDATKGEVIKMGNFCYICNGEMDEQAFLRFSLQQERCIRIEGDKHFSPSQIRNVEGLEYQQSPKESFIF